jgi:WD40 repeat protein
MSKRSIGSDSSTTAHKRHARATVDDEGPPPASLGHSPSSSVPNIEMSFDIHLIAGLILPFIPDRVTWNNVCCARKELYRAGRNLTPPWPNARLRSTHRVGAVAFSPSGSHLAFGTEQGDVHVWDRWGKETLLRGNTGNISCLEYSSDGRYLASARSLGGSIRLWHTESFHTTSTKTYSRTPTAMPLAQQAHSSIRLGNHSGVSVLAFSRTDSNLLASVGQRGDIKLWNVKEQACIHSYQGLRAHIRPTVHFPGGDRIVCNAVLPTGSMIRLWREEGSSEFTSETIAIPVGGGQRDQRDSTGTVCPAFSPCGSILTMTSREESRTRIDFYELETMIKSRSIVFPGFGYICSAFSPDSKLLVLGGVYGRSRLLQTDDFSIQRDLNTTSNEPVWLVAFDPTCRVLAFGGRDGRLELRTL